MNSKLKWLPIFAALMFAACGDDEHDHDHENESPVDEACEHMGDGPEQAVVATQAAADGPSIAYEHTRVDVRLFEAMDTNGGFVTFPVSEAGEYIFFLNNDTALALTDANGNPVAAESTTGPAEACPSLVTNSATFDLEVGTYTVELGPTSNGAVSIVVEEAGEHSD